MLDHSYFGIELVDKKNLRIREISSIKKMNLCSKYKIRLSI